MRLLNRLNQANSLFVFRCVCFSTANEKKQAVDLIYFHMDLIGLIAVGNRFIFNFHKSIFESCKQNKVKKVQSISISIIGIDIQ